MTDAVRVRIDLAYDGTGFSGWARQPHRPTVQQSLEDALAHISGSPIGLTCAGRTDAGVHARGQVAHADLPAALWRSRTPAGLAAQLNRSTDERIWIRGVREAPPGFDARFSALSRHYAYRLCDRPAAVDPLTARWVVAYPRPLDPEAMARAARPLVGEHDFAAFCKRREGGTSIRRVLSAGARRDDAARVVVELAADAFCHTMVRFIVGALVAVGEGRRDGSWVGQVLAAAARDSAVRAMPAGGLVLERVQYPPDEQVAQRANETRRVRQRPI